MMQLTLVLTDQEDGVSITPQTNCLEAATAEETATATERNGLLQSSSLSVSSSSSSVSFEIGAIAFYRGESSKVYPCQIRQLLIHKGKPAYQICNSSGLWLTFAATDLLTGWEADFPTHDAIDWGYFQPLSPKDFTEECNPEETAEDECDNFFDEYGDRAEDLISAIS